MIESAKASSATSTTSVTSPNTTDSNISQPSQSSPSGSLSPVLNALAASTSTPNVSSIMSMNNQLNNSSASSLSEEHHSYQLNEKVTHLATSIYQELEKIVKTYGRDSVKDLMPIVVNVLGKLEFFFIQLKIGSIVSSIWHFIEALDVAYQEKEEQVVENELLKDDNEQLLNQYEREKQSRKDTERVFYYLT